MLQLSEKHGVNPSITQCFVCMKEVGLALFGKMKGDVEAPRKVCLPDDPPCEECSNLMEQGVILISVDESKSPDLQNPWRTGGWVVVRDDFIERVVQPDTLKDSILNKRMAFIPDEAWDMIGLPRGEEHVDS